MWQKEESIQDLFEEAKHTTIVLHDSKYLTDAEQIYVDLTEDYTLPQVSGIFRLFKSVSEFFRIRI